MVRSVPSEARLAMRRIAAATLATLALLTPRPSAAQVPTPETHFGFQMGADRKLASAEEIERYFERVAEQSDRVRVVDLGPTTEGHRTPAAIVSAPANIANLERIRTVNRRLADPRLVDAAEARQLASSHKVVVAIGASIHASEIGATQAANELLHWLATASDPATLNVLDNVVIIVIPMLNPDGHRLVTDWYGKTLGTPFEGGPMPWLYQKYAGHDINRDAFMMNLAENRNLANFFYKSWQPQVFLTLHQMEPNGPRFFVPPNTDPIDLNYDPLIWRTAALLGDAMALEMQRDGLSGVVSSAKYDYYWPGFEDSAPLGHNTVCLLTEVASVNVATPITVPRSELRGGFKGLLDYRPQINFPDPWPGGLWTPRDIVEYELSAVRGLLTAAAAYREALVQNFYTMGRRAIDTGRRGGPYAYIIPPNQFDLLAAQKLKTLLLDGGVEIMRAVEPFAAGNDSYPEGTEIVFMAQPYRAYVKTLMEKQEYPARRQNGLGALERPYDAAGWTLPAQLGVHVVTVDGPFEPPTLTRATGFDIPPARVWGERKPSYWLLDAHGNAGAIALNRIVAAGGTPSWLAAPLDLSGYRFESGTLVVPHNKALEPIIPALARDLGMRVDGAKGKLPASAMLIPAGRARLGVYKPWVESIDEGWTRWALERHEFAFTSLDDRTIRNGNLRASFDAIVLPSLPTARLVSGFPRDIVPSEYAGGLSPLGVEALKAFVEEGGTLICLGQSSDLAISAFDLPLRDVAGDDSSRVFVPGSILKIDVDPSHPLGFGMPKESTAFFGFSAAFEGERLDAPVHYASQDLLVSGWLEGERQLAGRAAVVQVKAGQGRVVLLGFPVQHRGQTLATFRLLFNAVQTTPPAPPPPRRSR